MSTGHNRPTNDSTDEEWFAYLRGRRFHSDQEPKPVANYVAYRGFWVPPTLLPEGVKADDAPVTAPKRRAVSFNKAWFNEKNVQKLAEKHPDAYVELKRHIAAVDERAHADSLEQRDAEFRARLELPVEAKLMSAETAERRYQDWVREGRPAFD